MAADEASLRERFPEIPWGQPQEVSVMLPGEIGVESMDNALIISPGHESFWVCRYCVALYGAKASDLLDHRVPFAFAERDHCFNHIEREHHA
jgi:hypothetical protein